MAVVGKGSSARGAHPLPLVNPARRRRVGATCGAIALTSALVVNALTTSAAAGSSSATTTTRPKAATVSAKTTTRTTVPAPVIPLAQFPVQGPCAFIDTYGAPRGGGRTHEGVDIIAKKGQFVYAAQDGVLTKQYVDAPGLLAGNGWRLTTTDGTYFFYGHLASFASGLTVGSAVVAGQLLGLVGETGNAGTPHLHFEIHPRGGPSINPTASVKAVDGCKITTPPAAALVPAIPGAAPVTTTPARTVAPTQPPSPTSPAPPATPAPSGLAQDAAARWQFIEPVAVLTASSATALSPRITKKVTVIGATGIAKSTSAVIVRISATSSVPASVVVYPCDSAAPLATTLFVEPGPMAIGFATVSLVNGQLCVASTARTLARITVVAQLANPGVGVTPMATQRALDTRTTTSLAANQVVTLTPQMLGTQAGVQAVAATFTVLGPKGGGTLLITPCGGNELKAPFNAGRTTSFSVAIRVNDTGLCLKSSVAIDLLVDVSAAWIADASALFATTPIRRLDTRVSGTPIGAAPTQVSVGNLAGAPANVSAVQANVTAIGGSKSASLFVWPCAQPQPEASVGVVSAKRRATFTVITAVSGGAFCIASNAPVDVVVDIVGVG